MGSVSPSLVAGDGSVEVEARDGHAVDKLAGIAVEDAQKAAALAVGGDRDASVGQADHAVDIAVEADLVGVLPVHADGTQALVVGDDDVALVVKLHVVGIEPTVLGHVDGSGGQLVALTVEGTDVGILLELLVGEVLLGVHGVIAVAVVPGGVSRLQGDKTLGGEPDATQVAAGGELLVAFVVCGRFQGLVVFKLGDLAVLVHIVKEGLVDVVLALVLGFDALGDVLADLLPLAEVEAVVAVAADADEVGTVVGKVAVFGSVHIFWCGGRLGGAGGGAAAAAGAAAGAERKAQCQHEKQAYDILHLSHCVILLDDVLVYVGHYNYYMMAKRRKAFRRAALRLSAAAWRRHIFIAMSIAQMIF